MLDLVFITSNNEKLSHARYLCRNHNIKISKQKNYGIGYIEPRIKNRDELIRISVQDASERFHKNTSSSDQLFFIEDTSIAIESLSIDEEYPGLDVKYWMKNTTFDNLDLELRAKGNNRKVVVRSDVILVLNNELKLKHKKEYIVFTSKSLGSIVERESKNLKTQPLFPWLNNRTFNKWFVPHGETKPLSLLPISKANKYDFRQGAFLSMLNFLEEQNLLKKPQNLNPQLTLFNPTSFLITGPTCAGKSTISEYLLENYNYYYLEASDFMHLSYYETHGTNSDVRIGDFAKKALEKNPSIVVDQIIKHLDFLKKDIPFIISGFRSPSEIKAFKKWKGELSNIQIIYIDCHLKERYKRDQIRNRADKSPNLNTFQKKNDLQDEMGLTTIKSEFVSKNYLIINDKSYSAFYQNFEVKFHNELTIAKSYKINKTTTPRFILNQDLQNAIITALYINQNGEKYYTTTEIAKLIENTPGIKPKNKNNISRYFNQYFHPFYEINEINKVMCYRLSQTGKSYYNWLKFDENK